MNLNPIAFAIPLFLLFMALEYRVAVRKGRLVHRFSDTIANLNVGIAERLTDLLTTGLFFAVFERIHHTYGLFDIQANSLTWILLFLCTDLLWYWYHRFGHQVNLFWSAHVVHHQSEEFNYSVSARITVFQSIARSLFWCILPWIGFPAPMITTLLLIHGAYPFFTHTRLIGKLGWMEYFLVTPSHHRVHHSSNPQYLDKNYGDVLIIWDKFFGTFREEKEEPQYGLTKPIDSYSFLWQHFHFMLELYVACRRTPGIINKCRLLAGRPDAIDPAIRPVLERKFSIRHRHYPLPLVLKKYLRIQTGITLVMAFLTILFSWKLSSLQLGMLSALILLGVISTGAMLEQQSWIFHLDVAKLVLTSILLSNLFRQAYPLYAGIAIIACILLFYRTLNKQYDRFLFRYPDT